MGRGGGVDATYLDEGIEGLGGLKRPVGEVVQALDEVAHGGQHAHAAVLELGGAVVADGRLVLALGQAQGVEFGDLHIGADLLNGRGGWGGSGGWMFFFLSTVSIREEGRSHMQRDPCTHTHRQKER